MTHYMFVPSPIGTLLVTSNGTSITRVFMPVYPGGPAANSGFSAADGAKQALADFGIHERVGWQEAAQLPVLRAASRQLREFFAGERTGFDLPLEPAGSEFERRVWTELTRIPFGQTISYGELARRVGQPGAARAVGLANGRNPISIVVPCHRVIGANGRLTGYGGGLDRKQWLLAHEGVRFGVDQPALL